MEIPLKFGWAFRSQPNLKIPSSYKHRAIGNRGYTNEVRLSGLSETRAGGFSLYSPRFLVCSRSVRLSAGRDPPKRDAPKSACLPSSRPFTRLTKIALSCLGLESGQTHLIY